jgi:hypothetical protein
MIPCYVFDEISQLAAKEAGEAAYMLSNGQGKPRASREATLRKPARWRTLSRALAHERGAQLARLHVKLLFKLAHPGGEPVKLDKFTPRIGLGEASAHSVSLSLYRFPACDEA